ncbi:MAG: DUF4440 domain-containing protein [Roseibacillus sp.]
MTPPFSSSDQVLDAWVGGINTGAIDEVAGLYHHCAVLLPTFSNRRLANSAEIRGYFETLFKHDHVRVSLQEKTLVSLALTDSVQSMSGIYSWQMEIEGDSLNIEARFSVVLDLQAAEPIVHHHSSQVPRML